MFSEDLTRSVEAALEEARKRRHEILTVEHLFLFLLQNEDSLDVLKNVGADVESLRTQHEDFVNRHTPLVPTASDGSAECRPEPSNGFNRVIHRAVFHVQSSSRKVVKARDVLVSLFAEKDSHAVYLLDKQGIARIDVVNYVAHGISKREPERTRQRRPGAPVREGKPEDRTKRALDKYTTNLNQLASEGKLDPLIGRDKELERVIQILCRRRKNNPLLIGESGVGKTAIAEGLAQRIVGGKVPEVVAKSTVLALDIGSLVAGTKWRGEFEKRLTAVIKELQRNKSTILFIDEIHMIIGAGSAKGTLDASGMLKPMLASGELKCMGSTTYSEYRGIFEKDRALSRRFQKIDVTEPSVEDAYRILRGLKKKFESHFHLKFTDPALRSAAELSAKYITGRYLPDKAIDVLDEAGSAQLLVDPKKRKKMIGTSDIEQVVAMIARVPPAQVTSSDKQALRDLGNKLKMTVFGQDRAIDTLASAIQLSRAGLQADGKPIGSFLFAGPTGVGKTEVARQLGLIMGVELLRFDMSEYMERHTVSRLIGAPPGYVGFDQGGLLTEKVTKHPHSVLLLDEVEKAHPDVFNLLLQVMDHGTLTDANGRTCDFRNVVLVMTTNAGAAESARASIGFEEQDHSTDQMETLKRIFSPEFRNRLDAIVRFDGLPMDVIRSVVDKFLVELQAQLDKKKVELVVSDEAKDWLANNGYDEKMGARPMHRLIQERIKRRLAEDILFGALAGSGGTVHIDLDVDDLSLKCVPRASGRVEEVETTEEAEN